jgi:hypothetical protein
VAVNIDARRGRWQERWGGRGVSMRDALVGNPLTGGLRCRSRVLAIRDPRTTRAARRRRPRRKSRGATSNSASTTSSRSPSRPAIRRRGPWGERI